MTASIPFGLTLLSPAPGTDPGLFAAATLDPVTQLAYLDGQPLYEVVPPIAMGSTTSPDGQDAIAVDTDQPQD
ncbi:MAG: hypothetical protein L0Y54_19215 [Sporichthyaceae bacterium]|nr:hypothetical protein [Sporichthyaceae bacterium]